MTTSSFPIISKPAIEDMETKPNLDYDKVRGNFDWQQMYDELDWQPGGGLNKAHEAIDRHANGRNRDKIAMIWEGKNGEKETYTFGQMKEAVEQVRQCADELGHREGRPRIHLHGAAA